MKHRLPVLLSLLAFLALAPALRAEVDLKGLERDYHHGVAYYPELWPESEVDKDIVKMHEAGIDLVRIGEFAWSAMEPEEGKVSMDFFVRVMDKLHKAHIGVVFCTPTATPPIWLSYNHPERAFVDHDGNLMNHGARQHMSYDNPAVFAACRRIDEAIAKAIGKHPALVAWQIDNELKCHVGEDLNPSSIALWHEWLQARYGTIANLNEKWGTGVWSEMYQSFEQVPGPVRTPFAHNSSQESCYQLFSRDRIADVMDMQAATLRKYSDRPITTNTAEGFGVSIERLAKNLDFMAFDSYPSAESWMSFAFECDFFRSIKPGRPYFVMETSPSYNGWLRDTGSPHPPGFLAVEGAMAYGLGGHSFNYWLWREQRAGVEQPHGAVIYSWGAPEISFIEVQKVTALFQKLRPVLDATKPAPSQAAVTWSDRARVFMGTEPIGGNVDYHNIVSDWHHRLVAAGIPRDIRLEGASLDGLKLLVTPAMPYVSPEFLARVKPWVEAGGIWIAGPLTGMRTADHTVPTDANLGLLEKFAGIESVFSYPVKKSGAQGTALGLTVPLTGWCSAVRAASPDTTVLGTIATALPSNGLGFLTERKMGKGKVVLLTTQPDGKDGSPLLDKIVDHYASEAGLARVPAGDDLLVCPRVTPDGRSLWIILNMGGKPNSATLPAGAADALTGDTLPAGPLALDPYGCRVVKF